MAPVLWFLSATRPRSPFSSNEHGSTPLPDSVRPMATPDEPPRHRTRRRASSDVSVSRMVLRFALAGVVSLILVTLGSAFVSRRVGTNQAIESAKRLTWVHAKGVIEPNLPAGELDRSALDRLDAAVRSTVLRGEVKRVKLWDASGRIVYSDDPRYIGLKFELDEDELAILRSGGTAADLSDLSKPENRYEDADTKLLEVYTMVEGRDGVRMFYESYLRYDEVADAGRRQWLSYAPIALASLVFLQFVQVPLAWSMARRLRRSQTEREQLLRHAIEASDTERRRIASDLHDGVVQDLTGVTLSLAAASRRQLAPVAAIAGPSDHAVLEDAASKLRESIGSLRSLLVEIYPPNLHESGVEVALSDLLARLRNRGIDVSLTVDLPDDGLNHTTASLLYRTAQEALRNVVSHSEAATVRVAVGHDDHRVHLEVEDDGRGFDPDAVVSTPRPGHVGLRVLGDLVAQSGGSVTLESAPGHGTLVRVDVPLS